MNKCGLSDYLKEQSVLQSRTPDGRAFHSFGAIIAKLRSPYDTVRLLGLVPDALIEHSYRDNLILLTNDNNYVAAIKTKTYMSCIKC